MKEQLVHAPGCWYISGVDCAGTTKDKKACEPPGLRPCLQWQSGSSTQDADQAAFSLGAGMSGALKRRLLAKAKRTSRNVALYKASDNEVAARIKISGDGFIRSQEWRDLRSRVVAHYGGRCTCCGNIPDKGSTLTT